MGGRGASSSAGKAASGVGGTPSGGGANYTSFKDGIEISIGNGVSEQVRDQVRDAVANIPTEIKAALAAENGKLFVGANWISIPGNADPGSIATAKLKASDPNPSFGFYSITTGESFAVQNRVPGENRTPKDIAATSLHEIGHALDFGVGRTVFGSFVQDLPEFRAARQADLANWNKNKNGISFSVYKTLTYDHYRPGRRGEEVVAEGFATIFGAQRSDGRNSAFKKLYPEVTKVLESVASKIVAEQKKKNP